MLQFGHMATLTRREEKTESRAANHIGSEQQKKDEILADIIVDRPWSVFGEKKLREKKNGYTHVSLFSGVGGLDLGFRAAGFRTLWANDIDADTCESFRENLGEIAEGDIRTIGFPKLEEPLDVLSAGFPCQPFSNAGSRRGVKDK